MRYVRKESKEDHAYETTIHHVSSQDQIREGTIYVMDNLTIQKEFTTASPQIHKEKGSHKHCRFKQIFMFFHYRLSKKTVVRNKVN